MRSQKLALPVLGWKLPHPAGQHGGDQPLCPSARGLRARALPGRVSVPVRNVPRHCQVSEMHAQAAACALAWWPAWLTVNQVVGLPLPCCCGPLAKAVMPTSSGGCWPCSTIPWALPLPRLANCCCRVCTVSDSHSHGHTAVRQALHQFRPPAGGPIPLLPPLPDRLHCPGTACPSGSLSIRSPVLLLAGMATMSACSRMPSLCKPSWSTPWP